MTPRPGSVAVMGGTFDPIHFGHLAVAEEAREVLGIERTIFITAGQPPHKPGVPVTPAEDRLAMVQLAIAGNPAFEASRIEVDRPGPSYTLDTVLDLAAAERDAGREPDLTVILSAESFHGLPSWHEPERLLDLARIAVTPRDGYEGAGPTWLADHFPGHEHRVSFLEAPRIRLSASELRERIATGRSIRYLVPDAVIRYIRDHDLYHAQPGDPSDR